jgi:hypothetical protein
MKIGGLASLNCPLSEYDDKDLFLCHLWRVAISNFMIERANSIFYELVNKGIIVELLNDGNLFVSKLS